MTTPYERTKAVVETREFLHRLAQSPMSWPVTIQEHARQLLRHFPLDVDLEVSAAALPGIWTTPR